MKEITLTVSSRHLNNIRSAKVQSARQARILTTMLLRKGLRVTVTVRESGKTFHREVTADYYMGVTCHSDYAPTRGAETTREWRAARKGAVWNLLKSLTDRYKIAS